MQLKNNVRVVVGHIVDVDTGFKFWTNQEVATTKFLKTAHRISRPSVGAKDFEFECDIKGCRACIPVSVSSLDQAQEERFKRYVFALLPLIAAIWLASVAFNATDSPASVFGIIIAMILPSVSFIMLIYAATYNGVSVVNKPGHLVQIDQL